MPATCHSRTAKLWLWAMAMGLAAAVLVAFGLVAWTAIDVHASDKPDWLGNSPENVRRLTASAEPDDLVFCVVGDSKQRTETFERLLRIAARSKPDFLVLLGDFVSDREFTRHQLFVHEMAEQDLPFPVFLIPGNHDIATGGPFRLEDFQQLYGPAQFHFTIGKCLFLFLNNAPGGYDETGAYLRFMEQVLAERAAQAEHVFVFAHVPPKGLSPLVDSRELYGSERFMELARKYHVEYVFSGDHHGYWKGKREGTTYVVCGGGGARLRGRRGRFHHVVRVAVENGAVDDTVLASGRRIQLAELVERNVVVHLWPLITRNGLSIALTCALLATTVSFLIIAARAWRRLRASGRARIEQERSPS